MGLTEEYNKEIDMKKNVFALVLLFVATNAFSDFRFINEIPTPFAMPLKPSDLGVKGYVTEIYQDKYGGGMAFGKPKKDLGMGFQFKETYSFKDGVLVGFTTYYNWCINCVHNWEIVYSSPNVISEVNECVTEKDDYNNPKYKYYKYIYTYKNGKLTQVVKRKKEDESDISGLWDIKYTNTGKVITEYWGNGKIHFVYTYNKSDKLVSCLDYDSPDGEELCSYQYFYNNKGQLSKHIYTNRYASSPSTRIYNYDARGWDSGFSYDIDGKGNWLLKYQQPSKPNDGIWIYERKITY